MSRSVPLLALVLLAPTVTPGDRTPPVFKGVRYATTCVPGPVGGGRKTSFHLRWRPAHDNRTRSSGIVYDIYQATAPGGESFGRPTYTTKPGATTFATPPLSSQVTYYFVVRARDAAGNRDANSVEARGENLCV